MKPPYWVIGICAVVALSGLARHAMSDSTDPKQGELLPRPRALSQDYLGAGSCSASACHGNRDARGVIGSEFAIWATRDPHAKAYESLFNAASVQIQENLHSNVKPHEDIRCLKCHVAPDYELPRPPHFNTDGVSCETCHGPAKRWIDVHHLAAWKQTSIVEKEQLGMRNLHGVVGRAQSCVPCHVGAAGMDVDHDLLAAGHPRLRFELTAFHAHMPRHWQDARDRAGRPDFQARLWVAGQIVAAHAGLELLAHRADPKRGAWPEFAEHDCAACHHDLADHVFRDFSKRKPGVLTWVGEIGIVESALKTLDSAGDAKLSAALGRIRANVESSRPDRQAIGIDAKYAAARLASLLPGLELRKLEMKYTSVHTSRPTLDQLLAAIAMRQARVDMALPERADERLDILLRQLHITPYEPAAIRTRLLKIPR